MDTSFHTTQQGEVIISGSRADPDICKGISSPFRFTLIQLQKNMDRHHDN
jgi:hypothetical protein